MSDTYSTDTDAVPKATAGLSTPTLEPPATPAAPPTPTAAGATAGMPNYPTLDYTGALNQVLDEGQKSAERYVNATTDAQQSILGNMQQDRNLLRQMFKEERVAARLPAPWNEKAERQRYFSDPMTQFGSMAAMIGILGSALTKQPLTGALNAGAAAMNAIQAGEMDNYKRAYDAWKENANLAYRQFQLEHQVFSDAAKLYDTDMAAGRAKMELATARFGAERIASLLRAGLDAKVFEAVNAGVKMKEGLRDSMERMENFNFRQFLIGDAVNDFKNSLKAAAPDLTDEQIMNDPKLRTQLAQFQAAVMADINGANLTGKDLAGIDREMAAWTHQFWNDHHRSPSGSERTEEYEKLKTTRYGAAGGTTPQDLTTARQRAQDVARFRASLPADMPDVEKAKAAAAYERELATSAAPITGNRRDQLEGLILRADLSNGIIDKAEALLLQYKALTGVGGKATRPAEIVGNWFGRNHTERARFAGYINELREWDQRLLNESFSRGLTADEERIRSIIPGLEMGASTQNVQDKLLELKEILTRMKENWRQRAAGTSTSGETGTTITTTPPPKTTTNWYDQDKVVTPAP
jgi:hypothetical protein